MSANSWLARRLRSGAAIASTPDVARNVVARATVVRRRHSDLPRRGEAASRLVVCGDDPLAYRLIGELTSRYSAEVIAIMPNRRRNHGPQIAKLPGVRIVESDHLDVETFRHARLGQADAVAMTDQDDVGNIHAALQAQEVNPNIRLVLRMFNMSLGHGIRRLLRDCVVLSDAAMAAPAFVSAALGEVAPVSVRLQGKTLYVTRRAEVRESDIVCGLARTTRAGGGPDLFPRDQESADLVLAVANGHATGYCQTMAGLGDAVSSAVGDAACSGHAATAEDGDAMQVSWRPRRVSWREAVARRWRDAVASLENTVSPKLRIAVLTLLVLLVLGTVAMARVKHSSWADGAYITLLTTLGGAEPDSGASGAEKVLQALLTVVSIALIPVITAAVVEAVVNARLTLAFGRLRKSVSDHVVVVGLGNVGTRVIRQLHALGIPVVAIDRSETAKGAHLARTLKIPLIIGDASRAETLQAASVQTCRALVCLSTDDETNIEAALYGKGLRENLRVVLRLFDGDFADRAQLAFGITSSRSVSDLAAPKFAAALVERRVIETIPVSRRVLLVAEVPVSPASRLDGGTIAEANEVGRARVIALTGGRVGETLWCPPESHVLSANDILTVVATRGALARLLAETGDPLAREDAFPEEPRPTRPKSEGA
ncbi:MAG: NAD-binding protein [Micromonosporaceae bacterium]|nr:NAD-binding protein [Micromonosporaceae bacterium]